MSKTRSRGRFGHSSVALWVDVAGSRNVTPAGVPLRSPQTGSLGSLTGRGARLITRGVVIMAVISVLGPGGFPARFAPGFLLFRSVVYVTIRVSGLKTAVRGHRRPPAESGRRARRGEPESQSHLVPEYRGVAGITVGVHTVRNLQATDSTLGARNRPIAFLVSHRRSLLDGPCVQTPRCGLEARETPTERRTQPSRTGPTRPAVGGRFYASLRRSRHRSGRTSREEFLRRYSSLAVTSGRALDYGERTDARARLNVVEC
jgi:hypothetical protein